MHSTWRLSFGLFISEVATETGTVADMTGGAPRRIDRGTQGDGTTETVTGAAGTRSGEAANGIAATERSGRAGAGRKTGVTTRCTKNGLAETVPEASHLSGNFLLCVDVLKIVSSREVGRGKLARGPSSCIRNTLMNF